MTITVAVTITGHPCPLGFPSHQGGAAASRLAGCHRQGCFSTILCIPFFPVWNRRTQGTPAWGSKCISKSQRFALLWVCTNLGVHKLAYSSYPCVFLSVILRILTLFLLLFVWGLAGGGGSSPGRQETPDAAGHSVFLTCVNGLTNQCDSSRVVISLPLSRIYMRLALRSVWIPCTQRPLSPSLWTGLAFLPAALCVCPQFQSCSRTWDSANPSHQQSSSAVQP